jgi:hypothetical protein
MLLSSLIDKLFFVQVSLATDFMYNHLSIDVTASVGYDYNLRQVRHMQFGFDIFFSHVFDFFMYNHMRKGATASLVMIIS